MCSFGKGITFEADYFFHMVFLGTRIFEEAAVFRNTQTQSRFCFMVMDSDWPWQVLFLKEQMSMDKQTDLNEPTLIL